MRTFLSALLALSLLACGDDDGSTTGSGSTVDMGGGGGGGGGDIEQACRDFLGSVIDCSPFITQETIDMTCPGLDQGFRAAGESEACRRAIIDAMECATLETCTSEPECLAEEMAVEDACEVVEAPT